MVQHSGICVIPEILEISGGFGTSETPKTPANWEISQ